MTEYEYIEYERQQLRNWMAGNELDYKRLSRQEKQEVIEDMRLCATTRPLMGNGEPENVVADRVGWLLDGTYGRGAYDKAREIVGLSGRANKRAMLFNLLAVLEWNLPQPAAAKVWQSLTPEQQQELSNLIDQEIERSLQEE